MRSHLTTRGFTLLELIMVMVIMGVLAVSFSTRFTSSAAVTISTQADLLARHLRHAQLLAMNLDLTPPASVLRVTVTASNYSTVCVVSGGASSVCPTAGATTKDPVGNQALAETLDDGVTLSGSNIEYDAWGRPVSAGSLLTTARVYTLSGGGKSYTVTVSPVTGYVAVAQL